MGHLVTLKVPATQIIQHTESYKMLEGSWAETSLRSAKVVLFAQGECLIGSDLREVQAKDIDTKTQTLTLVVPRPHVISSAVRHDRSDLYEISSGGLERLIPNSDLQKTAVQKSFEIAQAQVRQFGESEEVNRMARENTETVLRGLLQPTGWTVKFEWAK